MQSSSQKENAVLRLHSLQTLDGDTHNTDLNSTCFYSYSNDKVEIRYKESGLDEHNAPDTVITVLPRQVVTIQRAGEYSMNLVLEQGKTHETSYRLPEGDIALSIYTEKVKFSFRENGGLMLVRYNLDLGGMIRTSHSIRLHVKLSAPATASHT